MTTDNRNDLPRMIKQQRVMRGLTLRRLSEMSGVSASHLGRVERGERFPSGTTLRKIANPLGFGERELFAIAGYLPPQTPEEVQPGRLDPYVAAVLSQEPVEVQRALIVMVSMLKSVAQAKTDWPEFREYAHRKYPGVDEDIITMIEDILRRPPKG